MLYLWDNLEQVGIEGWWRWRPPLILILLSKFEKNYFVPSFVPSNNLRRLPYYIDHKNLSKHDFKRLNRLFDIIYIKSKIEAGVRNYVH